MACREAGFLELRHWDWLALGGTVKPAGSLDRADRGWMSGPA